jgi:hypothetical protein
MDGLLGDIAIISVLKIFSSDSVGGQKGDAQEFLHFSSYLRKSRKLQMQSHCTLLGDVSKSSRPAQDCVVAF